MSASRHATFAVVVLVAGTAALSLSAAGDGTLPGDVRLARWVQAHPLPLAGEVTSFTNDYVDGRPLTLAAAVVAVLLLAGRRPFGALVLALAAALRSLNPPLKALFDSPRPSPDEVAVDEVAAGLGFPSGHAMGAALVFGAVVYLVASRRPAPATPRGEGSAAWAVRLALAACLGVVLLVGYGRVHVGAHWPSDVLGGWLWGTVLLVVAVRLVETAVARWGSLPRRWAK